MAKSKKVVKAKKSRVAPNTKAKAAPGRPKKASRVNENSKALFLDHHLPKLARLKDLVNTATANLRNGYKAAKVDGFLKKDFDTAFRLKTQLGEKDIKAEIARNLTIANWLGYGLGKQLDLFMEDESIDSTEVAYAAGEEASRDNQPAAPVYAPGTPGYDAYMQGFHDHQESLAQGIKPTSGTPMTRSQFKAQQAAKKAKEAAEPQPLFTKRSPDEAA